MSTHPKAAAGAKPKRPHRTPPGITRDQARAAGLVLCSGATDRAEAEAWLMLAGLIADPKVSRPHLGSTVCNPVVIGTPFGS